MSFPICETIPDYELVVDSDNQCLRDLNTSELNIKYGENSFKCCGTEFDIRKRKAYFISKHICTKKHEKFVAVQNKSYKQDYGNYINIDELINKMRKEIRDYKTQLYYKSEEVKFKTTQIDKLENINTALKNENVEYREKMQKITKKKLRIQDVNLIDL